MKVLLLNGSHHQNGNTALALEEAAKAIEAEGVETQLFQIGAGAIRDCIDCGKCTEKGCIFTDDPVNAFIAEAKKADGFIFGTPVYYAHPAGRVLSFLDRVFYAAGGVFRLKPGASIAVARRAGTTASFDVMNKYFSIAEMPIVSSTYWNVGHGLAAGDILKDAEGLQTMRNLGKNMAYLLKCLEAGKRAGVELPRTKREVWTHFIR
jgi:multimeric flavodoxin WrbA